MRISQFTSLAAFALTLFALPTAADTIHRTDGKVLEDITIVEEKLVEVVYKKGSNQRSVASDEILRVEFAKKPRLVDEADQALIDGDVFGALDLFDLYVDGQINKPNERRKWAPAYAAQRAIEICQVLDDVAGVVKRSDRLITNFADSRYVPSAYLAKAGAQSRQGKGSAAQSTLEALNQLVQSQSLSRRWALEAQLGLILTDESMGGDAKRDKLEEVVSDAGSLFPTVASRAQVSIGETYLDEIDAASQGKREGIAEQAQDIFGRIVKDQKADSETLAAAYAGLGTALFHIGAIRRDTKVTHESLMNFLRVIVLYKDHSRYVSQSMFFAMLIFKQTEDVDRFREMKWKLQQRYPQSTWAEQANDYK
ncbi:MAG: hypothetical protein AAF682_26160 [Planctomycetota bacterium]